MGRRPNVLVTVPCKPPYIHKHVVMALQRMWGDTRVSAQFMFPTWNPLENAQAHVHREFLAGAFDFWVSIDADNPPTANPCDLVFLDLDIIGCPTPVLHIDAEHPDDWPIYWNAMDEVAEGWRPHRPMEGLQQVDATGGGCWVIARRVLERLKDGAPFQRTWNADGTVDRGNDFSFCQRARAAGFQVWAHYDYPCRHFVEVELTEVQAAFVRAMRAQGVPS